MKESSHKHTCDIARSNTITIADSDGDSVIDPRDNCPSVSNLQQLDLDADGIGNACDPDADGDGTRADAGDCDDLDPARRPGLQELTVDGVDNDCDGLVDEDVVAATPQPMPTTSAPTPSPSPTGIIVCADAGECDWPPPPPASAPPTATPSIVPAPSPERLDQQQIVTDAPFAVVPNTFYSAPDFAQTFVAGASGMVEFVSLYVGCCADVSGTPGGRPPGYGLLVTITDVNSAGEPAGGLAAYGFATVPSANLSTDGSLHWLDIPIIHRCDQPEWGNCMPVSAGLRYAVSVSQYTTIFDEDSCQQIEGVPECGSYQLGRASPSVYAAGDGLGFWGQGVWDGVYYPGAWHREDRYNSAISEYDLSFKTYMQP